MSLQNTTPQGASVVLPQSSALMKFASRPRQIPIGTTAVTLFVATPDLADLTAREREVLSWVARGKTNAEIADRLSLFAALLLDHYFRIVL